MKLVLIGLRGSGKSTIARILATRTGLPTADLDDLTARELGAPSVRQAWDSHGQAAFRDAESRLLASELARNAPGILALGGGTPTAPLAAEHLRSAAASGGILIVYLRASPAQLRARLACTDLNQRPSLTGGPVLVEVDAVFATRDPLYLKLAQRVVEVGERTPDEIAASLSALLK